MSGLSRRVLLEERGAGNLDGGLCKGGDPADAVMDLNGRKLETADTAKGNLQHTRDFRRSVTTKLHQ